MPTATIQIVLEKVKSSNIEAIGYEPKTRTLRIKFNDGGAVYDYERVPQTTYALLMLSKSKGSFFSEEIRPNFKAKRVVSGSECRN